MMVVKFTLRSPEDPPFVLYPAHAWKGGSRVLTEYISHFRPVRSLRVEARHSLAKPPGTPGYSHLD